MESRQHRLAKRPETLHLLPMSLNFVIPVSHEDVYVVVIFDAKKLESLPQIGSEINKRYRYFETLQNSLERSVQENRKLLYF